MKFLFIIIILLLFSCSTPKNIESFYYPIDDLAENGRVYEYVSALPDSMSGYYWQLKVVEKDGAKLLIANNINPQFEVSQQSIEKIVSNGTVLQQYTLFQKDSFGNAKPIEAAIQSNGFFPFEVSDSNGVFMYSVKWEDPFKPNHTTTLIRNRRFQKDTVYNYEGNNIPSILFKINDLIDDDYNGHLEIKYQGREIYAKGIGLVYTEKLINGRKFAYQLKNSLALDQFEALSKNR